MGNLYFTVVYIKARERRQDQVLNRMWLNVWYAGVPSMVTCLLVFALNFEGRLVRTEAANGMVSPYAYLASRSLLEIPLVVFLSLVALGVPAFAGADYYVENGRFFTTSLVWMVSQYCWDAYAAALAVAFDNALVGAAAFIGCWFSGFLFGGFLIPVEDIVWPLRAIHWTFPLGFTIRGMVYSDTVDASYDACDEYSDAVFCYCDEDNGEGCSGREVLRGMRIIYPLFSPNNTLAVDVAMCLGLAVAAKFFACAVFIRSTRGSTLPGDGSPRAA